VPYNGILEWQSNRLVVRHHPLFSVARIYDQLDVAVVAPGVDMGRQNELSAVPLLAVRSVGCVVSVQRPPVEVAEERLRVGFEDRDVEVAVVSGLLSHPKVGSPAPTQGPWVFVARHQFTGTLRPSGDVRIERQAKTPV
jgi:hypothetical protein